MSNQTAQPQKTREERNLERQKRQERKLELAQQPGSHVFQAPVGPEMEAWLQISRTLNDLFPRFKVQSGAFGRISDAKSERLNQAMIQLCLNAAHLCDEISKALPEKHLTFRCPRVMEKAYAKYKKDLLAQQGGGEPSAKTQRPVAVKAVEKAAPAQEPKAARPAASTPAEKPATAATPETQARPAAMKPAEKPAAAEPATEKAVSAG